MKKINEKRTKFDRAPTLEVSTDEVRAIPAGDGLAGRIIDWLNKKEVLGTHYNIDKGWDVIFNRKSIRNVLNHFSGDRNNALLETIPDLIKNGVYLYTTPKNDKGLESHVFAAKVKIDNANSIVGFVVREDTNGKRYYAHDIMAESQLNKKTTSRLGETNTAVKSLDGNVRGSANPESVYNILQKYLGVNSKN